MILKLELESDDAMELCALHHAFMEQAAKAIGEFPFHYSKSARITKAFLEEVIRRIPLEEIKRIRATKDF